MNARRLRLAVAVQRGLIPLAAIPHRNKLSAKFFKRRPAGMKKAGYLSLMGRKRDAHKREWLMDRGIHYNVWQSWLQSHRWHCVKPGVRRADCWVCRKDELQVLPEGS